MRADALFAKFLQTQRDQRLLIATRDDLAAVYAKNAIEMNRRQSDCIIVSQGLDPIIDGGASEKKEIDPNNRGSVVLGSVAYYMDRYGYDVLPLAQSLLAGETLPPRTVTQHILVTTANRDGRRTGCPEIGTDLLRNRRFESISLQRRDGMGRRRGDGTIVAVAN